MRCVSSVVYDEATHTQRFFGAHGDDVTCLAFHRAALPADELAATAQLASVVPPDSPPPAAPAAAARRRARKGPQV
jgi:hypothetical protein